MRVFALIGIILFLSVTITRYFSPPKSVERKEISKLPPAPTKVISITAELKRKVVSLKAVAKRKGFSTTYAFLIDMKIPSGKKRFFIYDLRNDSIIHSGLVAHGSCNTGFLEDPQYSNEPNTGCTSPGMYKVGYKYPGR